MKFARIGKRKRSVALERKPPPPHPFVISLGLCQQGKVMAIQMGVIIINNNKERRAKPTTRANKRRYL